MNVARRYPRFRRLLASLAVSQAGDWLYNLALLAFVYERTHSSAWLGLTTAARVLPIVVCGPLGGVVADRYDRRRLMLASDAIRLVLMLALALVAAAGLPVVLAPIIAALATAASSVYIPSVAATTPRLVDDADLPAANAARSAIQQVCIVAGPGFGALLLLLGPPSLAFAINGLTFALSALAVASIPARRRSSRRAASPRRRRTSCASCATAPAPCSTSPWRCASSAPTSCAAPSTAPRPSCCSCSAASSAWATTATATCWPASAWAACSAPAWPAAWPPASARASWSSAPWPRSLHAPRCWPTRSASAARSPSASSRARGFILVEVMVETGLQRTLAPDVFARAYGFAFPAAIAGIVAGSLIAAPLVALFGVRGAFVALGALTALYTLTLVRRPEPVAAPAPAAAYV